MSKQSLIAKYCAVCGLPLQSQVCNNDLCRNFGVKINLSLGQREIVLDSGDTAFLINSRQLAFLTECMTKEAPTNYWKKLEKTCFRQLTFLSEIASTLCDIERTVKNTPLMMEQREKTLTSLNRLACLVESKADLACNIGRKASAVVEADLNLKLAEEKLESDRRIYQTIKEYEAKNA